MTGGVGVAGGQKGMGIPLQTGIAASKELAVSTLWARN